MQWQQQRQRFRKWQRLTGTAKQQPVVKVRGSRGVPDPPASGTDPPT